MSKKVLTLFILSFALMITPAFATKPDGAGKGKGAMQAEQATAQMEEQAEQKREHAEKLTLIHISEPTRPY